MNIKVKEKKNFFKDQLYFENRNFNQIEPQQHTKWNAKCDTKQLFQFIEFHFISIISSECLAIVFACNGNFVPTVNTLR